MRTFISRSGAEVGAVDPQAVHARAAWNAEQNGYLVCGIDSIDVYRAAFGAVCPGLDAIVDRRPIGTGARQSYVFWIRGQDGSPLGCVELSGVWIVIHVGRGVRLLRDVSPDHGIERPYVGHDSVTKIGSDSQHREFRCAWKLSWQGGNDAAFVGRLGHGCLLDDMGCLIPDALGRLDEKAIMDALEKAHNKPRVHQNPWIALDNVVTQWW
jgi:hypothetical protein